MPGEVNVDVEEVLDSEVLEIEQVITALGERRQNRSLNLEAFRREAVERFGEIGFICDVVVWHTDVEGVFAFDFNLTGRTARKAFDRERMSHEVQNNLLEVEEAGSIKGNGLWTPK
jgi:hypothetical protein